MLTVGHIAHMQRRITELTVVSKEENRTLYLGLECLHSFNSKVYILCLADKSPPIYIYVPEYSVLSVNRLRIALSARSNRLGVSPHFYLKTKEDPAFGT
jgi:hypothetical protein